MNQVEINFIGIGTQKSGTTWLYHNLNKLPDFTLTPIKELHYFDRDTRYPSPNTLSITQLYKRFINWKWTRAILLQIIKSIIKFDFNRAKWLMKYSLSKYSNKVYLSLFSTLKGIKGEITPSYSILEVEDIQRMYKIAPKAKLILMLRNPIDRAWSHYRSSKKGREYSSSNRKYNDIIKFFNTEGQLMRSDYLSTLDNYSKVYPENQILICFYDAIKDCPEKLLQDIVQFIGGEVKNIVNFCDFLKIINKSKSFECPNEIKEYLKNMYYNQIKQLSVNYGGYFNVWLDNSYEEQANNENKSLLPTFCISNSRESTKYQGM